MISIFFALPALMYILGTFVVPCLPGLIGRKGVIFVACFILLISVFMVGTSPLINLRDSPKTIFIGLMLLGFGGAAVTIPVLPEMLDSLVKEYPGWSDS